MVNRPPTRQVYRRFSDCSVSEKLLNSLFLATMGVAYILAMVYLYTSHEGLDGKPGLSVDDVAYTYYGNRSGTRLEAALRGSMSAHLTFEERDKVVEWIYSGSPKAAFDSEIQPIFEKNCISCHSGRSGIVDLSDITEVKKLTDVDMGKSIGELARVSHIHLFGVGMLLFLIGRIFILCEMPGILKKIIVGIPFLAIFMDIGSWWLTHWKPLFAYAVMLGGGLTGLSIAFQILMSLYQMWLYKGGKKY